MYKYDLMLWILANFETVEQVINEIKNIELVAVPINEKKQFQHFIGW